jgi:hypothetical protein
VTLLSAAALVLGLASGVAAPSAPAAAPETAPAARTEASTGVAGPFYTYAAADDYADYLEDEYGFRTRVVYHYGRYYVLYW